MSGRHRRLLPPRTVNKRVMGAGIAGVAAVFAIAPVAVADPVAPTTSEAPADPTVAPVTDAPSTDAPTTDTPTSDTPTSDTPTSDAPSTDTPTSDAPSADAPSADAPSASARPGRVKAADKGPRAAVTTEAVAADFGFQKIRVGVQKKSGAWVPPDATTAGTELTIVETGPNVIGSGVTVCTTVANTATATDDPTATFCQPGASQSLARVTPAVIVEPGPATLDSANYYLAAPGDTVTVTQTTVNAHYLRDTATGTVPPCVIPDQQFPLCSVPTDVVFEDNGLPPEAADDTALGLVNQPLDIDVLANDTSQGAPESITDVTSPAHGTASVVTPSGGGAPHIAYTPAANFVGHDSFLYTLSTPNGTDTARVDVTVVAPPPTAVDDSATTVSGQAVTVQVLANDDANGGGALSVQSVGNPAHGTASINGSSIVYTPAADFVGTDTFTYTAVTAFGTDTATVTVVVTAPVVPDNNDTNALANTGVPSAELVDIGAGLLLVGGAATLFGRRRRPRGRHV
jgi:hypothetical protein